MSLKTNKKPANDNQLLFMPRLYQETMDILMDAREYFTSYGTHDQRHLNMVHKLVYSSEMSRITLRLSSIMSWIMARRAFHSGQLSIDEVMEHYRLPFPDACMVKGEHFEHILPSYVMHLHERSRRLYERILTLDHAEYQLHSA